jgi:Glycosyl transferase family 2
MSLSWSSSTTARRMRPPRWSRSLPNGTIESGSFRAAQGDWICFTDGDGQFTPLDLPQLLVEAQRHDVVVGYRFDRADNGMRKFNSNAWKWLIRCLMGVRIRDLDCAFKIFPRQVVDRLRLSSEGACISAEIMAQCVRGGVSIGEVPVNHYPRSAGKATGANLKVVAKAFRELPVVWQYRTMQPWKFDAASKLVHGTENGHVQRPARNGHPPRETVPTLAPSHSQRVVRDAVRNGSP